MCSYVQTAAPGIIVMAGIKMIQFKGNNISCLDSTCISFLAWFDHLPICCWMSKYFIMPLARLCLNCMCVCCVYHGRTDGRIYICVCSHTWHPSSSPNCLTRKRLMSGLRVWSRTRCYTGVHPSGEWLNDFASGRKKEYVQISTPGNMLFSIIISGKFGRFIEIEYSLGVGQ